jgi:hypothetical protein
MRACVALTGPSVVPMRARVALTDISMSATDVPIALTRGPIRRMRDVVTRTQSTPGGRDAPFPGKHTRIDRSTVRYRVT